MYIPIISGLIQLGQTWIEGKNKETEAHAEAKAKVIVKSAENIGTWEQIHATNSATSWKDEWITILFSVPLILAFVPGAVEYVHLGFAALEDMPEWYQYTVSVIVAASFGVRSAIGWKKATRK